MFTDYVENPVVLLLRRLGLSPNLVTIIGLLISGVGAYFIGTGQWWIGGLVVLFAGIFDLFDGALARATNGESRFGALLDSTVDRLSEAIVLFGLLAYYLSRDHDIGSILVYAAIIGSIMVSYLRARSEGLGIDCKVGVMTRPERVALVGIGLIVGSLGAESHACHTGPHRRHDGVYRGTQARPHLEDAKIRGRRYELSASGLGHARLVRNPRRNPAGRAARIIVQEAPTSARMP